jgi:hypothetical protein
VGYLLGETDESNIFKDPDMLRRFNDIKSFAENEKEQILFTLDAMIHEIKNRRTYTVK